MSRSKPSIDALISFKHGGATVYARCKRMSWTGGDKFGYVWQTLTGEEILTIGVPKHEVISDPGL